MSIADVLRVIALENRVVDLAERNRVLVARVAALEDHLTDFQAAVEARQALGLSAAVPSAYPVSVLQEPPSAPAGNAEASATCVRRREQAQVRLRRHRTNSGTTTPALRSASQQIS
jgi:hypothetical protein